ncbi:MAG TPA: tetratricopeptide repeat protein, partial [Acidimicrobiia bacterium]
MRDLAATDIEQDLDALLALARDKPREALDDGDRLLARLDPSDRGNRSVVLRALAIAARWAADNTQSISYARLSLLEAEAAGEHDLVINSWLTLAGSLAIEGDNEAALDILRQASRGSDGLLAAEVEFQRGTVLSRMGDFGQALESYEAALPVFIIHDDLESVAMTLHNS